MKEKIAFLKRTARRTGWLYLLFALTAVYGFLFVQPKILVSGNAVATANNMLANEALYRSCVAMGLVTDVLFVVVVLSLYQLLHEVNRQQARLMAGLVFLGVPVSFVSSALKFSALLLVKDGLLPSFPLQQTQELAVTLIKISGYCSQLTTVLWGLWLLPLGLLVYRSGFIPRLLGVLLLLNGVGYVVGCFTYLLFPSAMATVSRIIFPTYFVGEIPLILWLIIVGAKDSLSITVFSAKETTPHITMSPVNELLE